VRRASPSPALSSYDSHPCLASIWLHSTSSLCGSTPTPTLPRKRERGKTHLRLLAAHCARALVVVSPKKEGAGNAGCRLAPAVSCAISAGRCAHEHTGTAGAARHSLRDGFTAYTVLSPETNSFCLRRRRIEGFSKPGWISQNLRRLDASNGRQNHTALPSAITPFVGARPSLMSKLTLRKLLARPACRGHRSPHPTSVTIAIRPSSRARDGGSCRSDLG
jgi:hypothetical protein